MSYRLLICRSASVESLACVQHVSRKKPVQVRETIVSAMFAAILVGHEFFSVNQQAQDTGLGLRQRATFQQCKVKVQVEWER
jgi:hypothetical protein